MNTGQYISGAGHLGLIGWVLLGGVFAAEPEPAQVTGMIAYLRAARGLIDEVSASALLEGQSSFPDSTAFVGRSAEVIAP